MPTPIESKDIPIVFGIGNTLFILGQMKQLSSPIGDESRDAVATCYVPN